MTTTVAARLASLVQAIKNCEATGNTEWLARHSDSLAAIVTEYLPRGSGIDSGSHIDVAASNDEKLSIRADFHHMDENGCYDGWTEHTVTVRPGFNGLNIRVSGRDRNGIKEYLAETFRHALGVDCPIHGDAE